MALKVVIVQTDNRNDLNYLGLTKLVNKNVVKFLQNMEDKTFDYSYEFIFLDNKYHGTKNPTIGKIYMVNELLHEAKYDYIVFLDSDAWVQTPLYLHKLLLRIKDMPDIHGSFSRDPYMKTNTYINSGSFIIKVNDFSREMYKDIIDHTNRFDRYHDKWPYDQYYISDKIFKHRKHFAIFIPHMLNTPYGNILRHNWWKNYKMFGDLYALLDVNNNYHSPPDIDLERFLDREPFPNPNACSWNYGDRNSH